PPRPAWSPLCSGPRGAAGRRAGTARPPGGSAVSRSYSALAREELLSPPAPIVLPRSAFAGCPCALHAPWSTAILSRGTPGLTNGDSRALGQFASRCFLASALTALT